MSDKEINKVFVENLKRLLKENNMTRAELADRLNLGKSTISMWMNGSNSPRMELLDKIADIFGVTVDYLLSDKKGLDFVIADNIKKYRNSMNVSKETLGEYIGVSVDIIDKMETGEITPSIDEIMKISEGLIVSVETLLNLPEETSKDIEDKYINDIFTKNGYSIYEINDGKGKRYWIADESMLYEISDSVFKTCVSSINNYASFSIQKMLDNFEPKRYRKDTE